MKSDPKNRMWLLLVATLVVIGPLVLVWLGGKFLTLSQTMGGQSRRLGTAEIVAACALVGFLTSAILQIIKEQTRIRGGIHEDAIEKWLARRQELSRESTNSSTFSKEAKAQIEGLCAAGAIGGDDFYNLPTKQFCGQIANSIDLVMIEPTAYRDFFDALTSGGNSEHTKAVKDFLTPAKGDGEQSDEEQDRIRARVLHYAQRALDGLQIEATRRWKLRLLLTCAVVSVGMSLGVAMGITPPAGILEIPNLLYVTGILSIGGTLLAPVANDITTAIRGFGRR